MRDTLTTTTAPAPALYVVDERRGKFHVIKMHGNRRAIVGEHVTVAAALAHAERCRARQ